jgi:hypothetical protein
MGGAANAGTASNPDNKPANDLFFMMHTLRFGG